MAESAALVGQPPSDRAAKLYSTENTVLDCSEEPNPYHPYRNRANCG